MADLQAELARFEAELAGVAAQSQPPGPPGPPPPPTQYGGPPVRPPSSMPPPAWQGAPARPAAPPPYMPPAGPSAAAAAYAQPQAAPAQAGYYPPGAAQAVPGYAGAYAGAGQPAVDKATMLQNLKAELESQKVSKKPKYGVARQAAGKKWVDPNLLEFPDNDFRIFVGDLGNETTDEVLTKAFARFPTFNKAKVVRDKKTNKIKGYGFVSFADPIEGAKALREMDGKYIGNRPCKLRKSQWQDRSQERQPFIPGSKKKNHIGGVAKRPGVLHK